MITITCKECKHKQNLIDIAWIYRGHIKHNDKVTCPNCNRVLIDFGAKK